MIRVLVAEDSSTSRELLVAILRSDPEHITVVGEAKNGLEAVEMTRRLRPSIVTMDIRMPLLDGFEATRRIMIETPTPVVVVSGREVLEVSTSLNALRAGALAVLEMPLGPTDPSFDERCQSFLATVRAMADVKVVRRFAERVTRPLPIVRSDNAREIVRAVTIATSTGGPAALHAILSGLPPEFPVPILIVQHIAKGFVQGLATWLNGGCRIRVKLAEPDEPLAPATAYLAPDDRHLGVTRSGRILISAAAPVDGFRPSGTFLFDSAAKALGANALALILTGMGRDGVEGLRRLRAAGARILAQDEASSVVFGMPGAAVEAGLADEIVTLDEIAARLTEVAGKA